MGNLTSSLTIKLNDDLTGKAGAAAAALNKLTNAGKGLKGLSGVNLGGLARQLDALDKGAAKVNRLRDALNSLGNAGAAYRTARRDVVALTQALDQARAKQDALKGVKGKADERAGAAVEVRRLASELRSVTNAAASAKSAFAEQVAVVRELRGAGQSVAGLRSAEAALKAEVRGVNAELQKQAALVDKATAKAQRSAVRREAIGNLAAGAGVLAGHEVKQGLKETLHTYREFDKERRFGKVVMGLTDEEQKPLVNQAIHLGGTTRYNDVQVLEAQRELAARGLNAKQVEGLIDPASKLGMSLDLRLPDAVKQMEGALFGFKKPMATLEEALASAKQTADVQVKAAKISGMTPEDITMAYKYGATPARMSGLSEETLLAFAGVSKKANMGGDEAGVAFRALVAAAQNPTRGAKTAMLAAGTDYNRFQKMPDALNTDAFVKSVATDYGVRLDKNARQRLDKVFSNKKLIGDSAKFGPAVMDVLGDVLGGDDAKSKKAIAASAGRFRQSSSKGVDTNALVQELMRILPGNLPLANAIFGSKQGARIATAIGDPAVFKHMIEELLEHSEGFAEKVSKERNAGFDGAMYRLEGMIKNVQSRTGAAWDNDGKGGALTWITDKIAHLGQSFAELDNTTIQVTTGIAGVLGAGASIWGTLKIAGALLGKGGASAALTGSAAALSASAAALDAAAVALGGGKAVDLATKGAPAAAGAGAMIGAGGVAILGGAIAGALIDSQTPGQGAGIMGLITGEETQGAKLNRWLEEQRSAAAMSRGAPNPAGWGRRNVSGGVKPGGFTSSYQVEGGTFHDFLFGKSTENSNLPVPSTMLKPRVDPAGLEQIGQKADEAKAKLGEVSGVSVKPNVDASGLDALISKAGEALSALMRISSAAGAANTAIGRVNVASASGRVRATLSDNHTA